MRVVNVILLTLFVVKAKGLDADASELKNNTEAVGPAGKVFSLFSIVQFKNSGCKSQSTLTSGQSTVRNGTCYTSSECSNKGGTASGNCAAGFGVCCLFLVTTTGSTISQNCTYLRNPGFPSVYTTTGALTYTVSKCSGDVCYLRLDFETFTTLGPSLTTEPTGGLCRDTFKVTTNTGQLIPTICGSNTGQHIYVDIGLLSTDTASLAFTFSTSATTRVWEIKVSQILCSSETKPPNGCLQYWTTTSGRITTFNWLASTSSNLQLQQYSICVRRQAGYCCVQYQACSGIPTSFSIDQSNVIKGLQDTYCSGDYVSIPASNNQCQSSSTNVVTKYCGFYFGGITATIGNIPVCDCTPLQQIFIKTDTIGDGATTQSRGVCFDFMQVPCTTN